MTEAVRTPCYIFNKKDFKERIRMVAEALPGIPLTYSIKANSFLIAAAPEQIRHLEVCSPGELAICERLKVDPKRIIYSGVMKENTDVAEAIRYEVDILTAESPAHVRIIEEEAGKAGKNVRMILRLSSGNQFGMDAPALSEIISKKAEYPHIEMIGIHNYTGTQKEKERNIVKDLKRLDQLLTDLKEQYGFTPQLVEYGPGLAADYFEPPYEETDRALLETVAPLLLEFAEKYPLGIEMGRFLAAPCGRYLTQVKDLKTTEGVNYVILDGGIHQVKYYGQMMAMKVPPVTAAAADGSPLGEAQTSDELPVGEAQMSGETLQTEYTLCGSLCTTADVLVRSITLPELHTGDVLTFGRVGAYSSMEASVLFLSRLLPAIYFEEEDGKLTLLRDFIPADRLNAPLQA